MSAVSDSVHWMIALTRWRSLLLSICGLGMTWSCSALFETHQAHHILWPKHSPSAHRRLVPVRAVGRCTQPSAQYAQHGSSTCTYTADSLTAQNGYATNCGTIRRPVYVLVKAQYLLSPSGCSCTSGYLQDFVQHLEQRA